MATVEDFASILKAADSIPDSLNGYLSSFPASGSTILRSSSPTSRVWVFCSDGPLSPVQVKIRCAFEKIQVDNSFKGVIQFWSPVTIGRKHLLTTYAQPFALAKLENIPQFLKGLCDYRLSSVKNYIDVNGFQAEDGPAILSNAARPRVFCNKQQDLLMDLRFHETSLLASLASKHGLRNSVMLPVFNPPQSSCVGVVECSTRSQEELLQGFKKLSIALEEQGLKTFDAQEYLSHKIVRGLNHAKDEINEAFNHAKDEINEAFETVWQAHHLPFIQVWIASEDEDHVAFSSSSQRTQTTRKMWLKLTDKRNTSDPDEFDFFENYSHACYKIPLRMDENFAAENYEPHFIENILNLSNKMPERLSAIWFRCSCFVIYLRSTDTPGLVYAFEFLWRERSKNVKILESLLFTLKSNLPSFKFASGIELGDGMDILDVEHSVEGQKKYFKVFQGCRISLQREIHPRVEESPLPSRVEIKRRVIRCPLRQIILPCGRLWCLAEVKLNVYVFTWERKCKDKGIKFQGEDYLNSLVFFTADETGDDYLSIRHMIQQG